MASFMDMYLGLFNGLKVNKKNLHNGIYFGCRVANNNEKGLIKLNLPVYLRPCLGFPQPLMTGRTM